MKYKTLVLKQIDSTTYQYSINAPLTTLSPILSFDENILHSKYDQEFDYALSCVKNKQVLNNGFLLKEKENQTLEEWAPIFSLTLILEYYKNYKNLPPILMSVDQEIQSKYNQDQLIRNLFQ